MATESPEQVRSAEDIINSPEYQTKLENAVDDARKFAERVKAVAEGDPTEADLKQLREEYARISESALIAHDSIPDSANSVDSQATYIKGTDGRFMGAIRIAMREVLGGGDYNGDTPAMRLYDSKIYTYGRDLHEPRKRIYP